jgi:crotonobetainyl-CoA:carnitine CoA-transferase CaiB-like acyl-CoA transferase
MDGSSPLAGVRVLELPEPGGAFTGRLLAMLGADVVTVGAPPDDGMAASWFYTAGKRAAGPTQLARLAPAADVLIGRGARRFAGPRSVTCSVSPFGDRGPYASWRSSELVAQALGGMLGASGDPDGPPLPAPGPQAHHQAGVFGAIGVVAALLARERGGRGQHVEVSMQAAVAASLAHVHARFLHDGTPTRRTGRLHWTRAFRVGPTRDHWAVYTTLGDWTTLLEWLRADGMAQDLGDPAYTDPVFRRARAEHVFDVIDAWARGVDAHALEAAAQLRRLAFAAVRSPEALLNDPQLAARRFFVPAPHAPTARPVDFPGPPFRLGPLPAGFARPPDPAGDEAHVVSEWLAHTTTTAAEASAASDARRPLTGLRIADFTWLVAGPTATRVLADLGADVVRIEHPGTPDAGDRRGGFTGCMNCGKRSVVLDLATEGGRATAMRLALAADVVIDNFSARVMEQWGLDPATLRARKPELICVRMTGFGMTGPDRDQVSFGPTLEARAGYTALVAEPDGAPVGFGFSYADVASGHLAALGVLAACWRRRRTGEGAIIDFSQLEAVAMLLGPVLLERTRAEISPEADAAPNGVYRSAGDDRWIAITVAGDDDWNRFVGALGRPAWAAEASFATARGRVLNRAALDRHVAAWARTLEADAAMVLLQRAGVAAGRVADAVDLCARDPQLAALGFFVPVATPEGETVRVGGPPLRLSETPAAVTAPGPLLGEHTTAVLRELDATGSPVVVAGRQPPPATEQQPPAQHAAEMGEVRHAFHRSGDAEIELERPIQRDE